MILMSPIDGIQGSKKDYITENKTKKGIKEKDKIDVLILDRPRRKFDFGDLT